MHQQIVILTITIDLIDLTAVAGHCDTYSHSASIYSRYSNRPRCGDLHSVISVCVLKGPAVGSWIIGCVKQPRFSQCGDLKWLAVQRMDSTVEGITISM